MDKIQLFCKVSPAHTLPNKDEILEPCGPPLVRARLINEAHYFCKVATNETATIKNYIFYKSRPELVSGPTNWAVCRVAI